MKFDRVNVVGVLAMSARLFVDNSAVSIMA